MKSSIKILFAIVFAFLLISPSLGFADQGKHEAKGGHDQDAGTQLLEEGSGSSAMETPGGPAGAAKAAMGEGHDSMEGKGEYKEHKGEKGEYKAMEEGSDSKASPVATPKKKEGSAI